jgi:orotidine-5'-phosphate decarboxylase
MISVPARERLILPLDVPSTDEANIIVETLGDAVCFYKIGYQLMSVGGIDLAKKLSASNKKIFLDFKFLDIGATVEKGVASAVTLGGDFLTVHAERDCLAGAVQGRGGDKRLKLLAVTVLTSWDKETLHDFGIESDVEALVLSRAEKAARAGFDGVVASAKEAAAIRARFDDALQIVTPGVRPQGTSANDQKRVVTPAEAIKAGADYLVVGRPVLAASSPQKAAIDIVSEIEQAL